MNHPKPEEWAPFVLGESNPETRRTLRHHLRECPECAREIAVWKRSLGRLDRWKLPGTPRPGQSFYPVLRLAAAAALVLVIGFGVGRLTAPRTNTERLRAILEPQIRKQLRTEFSDLIHQEITAASAATLATAAKQTDDAVAASYLALKADLDTIAVNTAAGLHQTEQQIFRLADFPRPLAASDSQ